MATSALFSSTIVNAVGTPVPNVGTTIYYEDLEVGQRWVSPQREITTDDVNAFASLTGDFDPLHLGAMQSSAGDDTLHSPFGRPVAHGILGLSVLAGLSTEYPRVATLALVGITDWQFENPIFFGEVVHVVTEVEAVVPHGRRAGRITWLRKLVASDGRLLQQGRFITLVASNKRGVPMDAVSAADDAKHDAKHDATPRLPR